MVSSILAPATMRELTGRLHIPDERDKRFPMRALVPRGSVIPSRYWEDDAWWGDQGDTPHCVAYSALHLLHDGPVLQHTDSPPVEDPTAVYAAAQKIDTWPGEDYDGTSVRAGMEILVSKGYVSEYRWGFSAEDVADVVLEVGPVVIGSWWYEDMFSPDEEGVISLGGRDAGGHAYLINGYDSDTRMFRIKNSWGRSWGLNGHAYIRYNDLDFLIRDMGEAAIATEVALGPTEPQEPPVQPPPPDPTPEPETPPEDDTEPLPPQDSDSWVVLLVRQLHRFWMWLIGQ